jgi:hypothetical protein
MKCGYRDILVCIFSFPLFVWAKSPPNFRSFLLLVQKKEPKKNTPRTPTEILFGALTSTSRADKISVRAVRGQQPHQFIVWSGQFYTIFYIEVSKP